MSRDLAPGVRRNLPPTAFLRVFSPLRAFDDTDQLLIGEQQPMSRSAYEILARQALMARVSRDVTDPFPHQTTESYRVLHQSTPEGTGTFYCPDQLPLRAGMAAGLLEDQLPFALMDVVIPATAAEAHSDRLMNHGMWMDDEPLFTRESTWGVPLGWFAAVHEDDETEVEDDGAHVTVARVHTPLILAIERTARAAAILGRVAPELPLVEQVEELHTWLLRFHRDSVVELDYGQLAGVVWPDDSPRDLREGIEALEDQDLLSAAAAHRRLVSRWTRVRQWGRAG